MPSYGLSETSSGVVAVPIGEAARRPWSAGRPMPGVELRVGPGAPDGAGEILVRGPMVFDGYENDPEATAAALDAAGWLHTGDLGSIDADGWLRVAGRADETIITGGENVAPAEVEAVLAGHPAVADVAVLGVPDEKWGAVPVAFVVFRPGAAATPESIRAFARERLAPFKVPARVVEAAAIPRSPSGKLLRRSLPALAAAALATPASRRPSLAAATRIETDDGQPLAYRELPGPPGAPAILLLHGTLSMSSQLLPLAGRLQSAARVLLLDRRGSGGSAMEVPAAVSIARHVADVLALLDAAAIGRAIVFGHSFGAVVSLEFAARHPERTAAVVAYEPPYLALAEPAVRARLGAVGPAVAAAHATGGPAAAAETFLRAVAGDGAWDRMPPAQRQLLDAAGSGALADATMAGLDSDGLGRIACPVVLATGTAWDAFYAPIADAVAAAIPGAGRVALPGLTHIAPITDPPAIAALILETIAQDPLR